MFAPARIASLAAAQWQSLSLEERLAMGLFLPLALLPAAAQVLGGYLLIIGERAVILAIAALSLQLLIGVAGRVEPTARRRDGRDRGGECGVSHA